MFNFHKPRTYRSTDGCCICRAKSSSSRFTDSRKYERDTMLCFDLKYPRQGEICNACVLLVKRFKRLPVDSKRNWSHVVDAKAGPGGSKIQTKCKNERTSSRAHHSSNSSAASPPSSSSSSGSCLNNASLSASLNSAAVNGQTLPFLPEKFSKIFKKSKKIKETSSSTSISSGKRKSASNGWSLNGVHAQPTTPDLLDSDYEDSRVNNTLAASSSTGTVVQFQTQTRASAFRAQAAAEARRRYLKLGSKRRKCLQPRKNRRTTTYEETLQFFDDEEWRDKKSCCGMFYEYPAFGGAILLDVANYRPCDKHQSATKSTNSSANGTVESQPISLTVPLQKSLIHSIPAVVQLQPPAQSTINTTSMILGTTSTPSSLTITKTTPVLKKHHLFFKRQSECFPQGDMVTHSETNYSPSIPVNITKTESGFINETQHHQLLPPSSQLQQHYHHHYPNTTVLQRQNEHAIHTSAAASYAVATSSALSISVTPQMPKHSLAKVTTISPPLTSCHTITSISNAAMLLPKPHHNFLHKIKADTGKIAKHTLEKLNTAVRLKPSDLHDIKPIIKTVDKSYILAKPPIMANQGAGSSMSHHVSPYQTLSTYNSMAQPSLTTTSLSAASPTSSTSSTSSTKFSDNSSDSGFDEHMLDRKSASPLQEDCEKKLLSRPGVQTMFLASGVQIQGQPQNLVLTGNEVAAKILQNRKYSSMSSSPITSNARTLPINPTTTAVKIAQISTGNGANGLVNCSSSPLSTTTIMSSAAQAKMRAIYNNSNTIQHENGITTILPASSLAASTQTAAMQNIAPSTVTITPAPPVGTSQYNGQNVISRKLTAANIINLQSNNLSNISNLNNSNNCVSVIGNHLHSATAATANQKVILLKSSAPSSSSIPNATKYSTLQGTGTRGDGGR